MAFVELYHFGGAFIIVPDGGDSENEETTTFVHSDWDHPGIAYLMGWEPCFCGATDGTVDCEHRTASTMIGEAYDFIVAHEGEYFPELDDYLPEVESAHEQENKLYEYRKLQGKTSNA